MTSGSVAHNWRWSNLDDERVEVIDCAHSTPKLTADGPYLARTQDIATGRFRPAGAAHVSAETYRDRVARAVPGVGDLMYSREGAYFGVAAEVPAGIEVCLGQRMVLIRSRSSALDHRFLKYWLNSPAGLAHAWSHVAGSAAPRINVASIRAFPVPVPPMGEQLAIDEVLGVLDDKLESNRRLVHHSGEILDAAAEARCGSLPRTPLASLSGLTRATVSPAALGDALVDLYSLPAFDSLRRAERVRASTIMSNKIHLAGPAVLVSRLNPRTNRTWWAAPATAATALASTEFAVLTAQTELELGAIWLAVRHPSFLEELPRRVTGTSGSHQRVRPDDLLAIAVPDVRQLDDATKQSALRLLLLAHQRQEESAGLSDLRDTLLPELLSGRIRVPEAAAVVQDVTSQ